MTKVTTFRGIHKPFEMEREVKMNTRLDILDDRGSSRAGITKAKVVPSMSDEKLADTKDVNKNARHNQ